MTHDSNAPRFLDGRDTICLPELVALADFQTRRDRKYVVPYPTLTSLFAPLGAVRVLTISGLTSFRYLSVYFDTPALASYHAAAYGRPRRFKVRTRTYLDSGACALEVKTRDRRGLTVKHRYPYQAESRSDLTIGGRRFLANVGVGSEAEDQLVAVLATTYQRTTLVPEQGRARVTIDVDLQWTNPAQRHAGVGRHAIVETKTAGPPCAVDRHFWRAGLRPVAFSKYCTGLAALDPQLPSNSWHRLLQTYFEPPASPHDTG